MGSCRPPSTKSCPPRPRPRLGGVAGVTRYGQQQAGGSSSMVAWRWSRGKGCGQGEQVARSRAGPAPWKRPLPRAFTTMRTVPALPGSNGECDSGAPASAWRSTVESAYQRDVIRGETGSSGGALGELTRSSAEIVGGGIRPRWWCRGDHGEISGARGASLVVHSALPPSSFCTSCFSAASSAAERCTCRSREIG